MAKTVTKVSVVSDTAGGMKSGHADPQVLTTSRPWPGIALLLGEALRWSPRSAVVGVLEADQAVAVRVGEGEHRRDPLQPDQFFVVPGHPGPADLVVGLLSTRETLEPGGTTSTIRAPGQPSTSVRSPHPSTSV
jgi:hypothetical protein